MRVVVTGMGLAVGSARDKNAFEKMCFAGESSIRECTVFDTEGLSTSAFGQTEGLEELPGENGRFLALLRLAAEGLLADAGLSREDLAACGRRCRMFFGTLIYSADAGIRHCLAKRAGRGERNASISRQNAFSAYARKLLSIRGQVTVISSACASGTTAIGMAMDYIRNGLCDCAVAGGVDVLAKTTAYGFHALKSMSHGVTNPFDVKRDGINIGECGALFFLESWERAKARGADIVGEIAGYALANDAYHITSPRPDGEGAYRTMKTALEDAGISPEDIGYVNAHGTGTEINDSMEAEALAALFGGREGILPVSSTKALLGHAMGASGAIELASVLLALKHGKYIPMPRLEESIVTAKNLRLSKETFPMEAEYALKNSFAFGGNSAALVVRRFAADAKTARPAPASALAHPCASEEGMAWKE